MATTTSNPQKSQKKTKKKNKRETSKNPKSKLKLDTSITSNKNNQKRRGRERIDSFMAEEDSRSYSDNQESDIIDDIYNHFGVGFEILNFEVKKIIENYFKKIGSGFVCDLALRRVSAVYDRGSNGPDVLVVSFSENMLLEKFRVCSLVWELQLTVIFLLL